MSCVYHFMSDDTWNIQKALTRNTKEIQLIYRLGFGKTTLFFALFEFQSDI